MQFCSFPDIPTLSRKKIERTYVRDLLNLVSAQGKPMVGPEEIDFEISHSRLPENAFPSTRTAKMFLKNSSTKTDVFCKSHDVVLKWHKNRK